MAGALDLTRYIYVHDGCLLGFPADEDPRGILLVEQADGSWRFAKGQDLQNVHDGYPWFIQRTRERIFDEFQFLGYFPEDAFFEEE